MRNNMSDSLHNPNHNALVEKWSPVLEGISDQYTAKVTAILLENQAKSIVASQVNEDLSAGATTTGRLGTFQKFAFPLVRRVFPELIFNKIGSVQPMEGPVSQIFYLGSARQYGPTKDQLYSKYNLTYRGQTTSAIGMGGASLTTTGTVNTCAVYAGFGGSGTLGTASTTYGGQIAMWPNATTMLGWSVSAGEALTGTGIPELNISIEQQPVVARTKKMRALWTIEASQDLKAYHNLDLERELTELMSKELELEIDRELLEDLRGIAYNIKNTSVAGGSVGGWNPSSLDMEQNSNNFGPLGGTGPTGETTTFTPTSFTYAQGAMPVNDFGNSRSNVFVVDLTATGFGYAPQHAGHVYANLLAIMNFASQDIYKTTHRGPGNWIVTSPLIGAMLESAAKLEGGIGPKTDGITNMGANKIEYRGKFAGKYDLFIDPLWPEDEIMMGYKGGSPMDGGFVYCPYIPIEALPTITDPETFQPRKGILTRYAKAAIQPANRFYRIIRLVGPAATYLYQPFVKTTQP